jgi:hypothetical protein
MVAAGLRHLQGGRVKDARHIVKTSRAACYAMVDDFIDAVNSAPELDINLPQNADEWRAVNEAFRRRSFFDTMSGTVGALDGFFQRCNRPTMKETNNIVFYYSGHYESYGVNCLAAVKADLQFIYFGVISPGSTNDITSYAMASALRQIINSLPLGLYFVGDATFPLGEKLLTPFIGTHRHSNPYHDSFNFYLSQLRIRVEMAFGRMVNKFRILSGKVSSPSLFASLRLAFTITSWPSSSSKSYSEASLSSVSFIIVLKFSLRRKSLMRSSSAAAAP